MAKLYTNSVFSWALHNLSENNDIELDQYGINYAEIQLGAT